MLGLLASAWLVAAPPAPQPTEDPPPAIELPGDDAVRIAHGAGLEVVTDRCIKVEHARLLG